MVKKSETTSVAFEIKLFVKFKVLATTFTGFLLISKLVN